MNNIVHFAFQFPPADDEPEEDRFFLTNKETLAVGAVNDVGS